MLIVVTTFHVLACIVLVLSVLLQAGKGADMGAVFGGASSTIFGGGGAGNFLTRITAVAAVVFMFTSLTLTYGPQRTGAVTVMPESVVIPGADDANEDTFGDAAAPPLDAAPVAVADPVADTDANPIADAVAEAAATALLVAAEAEDGAAADDAPAAEAPADGAPAGDASAPAAESGKAAPAAP